MLIVEEFTTILLHTGLASVKQKEGDGYSMKFSDWTTFLRVFTSYTKKNIIYIAHKE